jgi:hypothetical protein
MVFFMLPDRKRMEIDRIQSSMAYLVI